MAIPEGKLESWASQGAITASQYTHESVERALNASSELKQINFDKYLQGSYKNSTNIRGESDVDIVIQLNKIYNPDISGLSTQQQAIYNASSNTATYTLSEFKGAVIVALETYFDKSHISEGDKCIKIDRDSNRLDADVIVCNQYRKYKRFISYDDLDFIEGILFFNKSGRKIISYPKEHYDNGVNKNSTYKTNGWFKPTVRIFKNARTHLINNGIIDEKLAPSFFVECLLYNVPDRLFGSSYSNTYVESVNWLQSALSNDNYQNFVCLDEQFQLFGHLPGQWDRDNAHEFIINLVNLWNNW